MLRSERNILSTDQKSAFLLENVWAICWNVLASDEF